MEEIPSSSSAPADDFIHLSLEKSTGSTSLTDSFSKSQYCQIVFHDLSEVYPTDGDICFTYSFQPGVIPQIGDRIALYKVGWSSVSEYITSVYASPPEDNKSGNTNKITFSVESLPKDETNMYQFCYITSGNIVAGSSIPFTFRKPLGNELVAVEDPNDSGLVVFRSRVTQLQEQLVKSNAEKESLDSTLSELKSELYLVKAQLNEKHKKCELHKENIQDMTNLIYDLNTEKKELIEKLEASNSYEKRVDELQAHKVSLESDLSKLQELINSQANEIKSKEEAIKQLTENEERLEQTVSVLNKALSSTEETSKSTLEDLRAQLEQANSTISHFRTSMDKMESNFENKLQLLRDKFNEERKLFENQVKTLKDELNESNSNFDDISQCMIEKEKDFNVKADIFTKKLKNLTERNNAFGAEVVSLNDELGKAKIQVRTLDDMVKSKDRILKDVFESNGDGSEMTRKFMMLEDENSILQVQVFSLEERLQTCEADNAWLNENNNQLKEEKLRMTEQLSRMNEELRHLKHIGSQSQARCSSQPGFHSSSSQTQQNGDSTNNSANRDKSPFSFSFPFFGPFQSGGASVNVTAKCSDQTSTLQPNLHCDKCMEMESKVKNVLKEKSEIRSDLIQTKHTMEEYNIHLRDVREEAAALRSRIAVLEIELRKAKEASITKQGEQMYNLLVDTFPWKKNDDSMASSSTGSEFRSIEQAGNADSVKQLEQQLQKELETKVLLQRNVESLMISDAKHIVAIDSLKKENTKLVMQLSELRDQQSTAEEVIKAIDDIESSKVDLMKKLESTEADKSKLENQLIELRKESVGKVSLSTVQELRNENEALKQQLIDKNHGTSVSFLQAPETMEGWSIPQSTFPENSEALGSNGITCPACNIHFPPGSDHSFNRHLRDHLD